ncbi:MAG TPA: hypothetical protein VFU06_14425 [Longimicrobiales bacterium]|nr:hypothetical protein [Longimicrobiales bacterium]
MRIPPDVRLPAVASIALLVLSGCVEVQRLRATASSPGLHSASTSCQATPIDSAAAQRLMDHVERAYGREPDARGYFELQSATAALVDHGRCLTAVALSYDRELGGGMVILDPRRPDGVPLAAFDYQGAREPFAAGAGRLGVTYTHVRGYGLYESRIAVACALEAAWNECLSVTRDMRTTVVGAEAPLHAEQETAVALRGDTLVLRRTVTYEREGEPSRRPTTSVSRLVLPAVP